jgi:hypothetical protein
MHLGIEKNPGWEKNKTKQNPKKENHLESWTHWRAPPKKNQNPALGRTKTQCDKTTTSGLLSFVMKILEIPFSHSRVITGLAFYAFFSAPSDIRRSLLLFPYCSFASWQYITGLVRFSIARFYVQRFGANFRCWMQSRDLDLGLGLGLGCVLYLRPDCCAIV